MSAGWQLVRTAKLPVVEERVRSGEWRVDSEEEEEER